MPLLADKGSKRVKSEFSLGQENEALRRSVSVSVGNTEVPLAATVSPPVAQCLLFLSARLVLNKLSV